MNDQTQKQQVRELVTELCQQRGIRTFELQDFYNAYLARLEADWPRNSHVKDKIRQLLQNLRDDEMLNFNDKRGSYTLRDVVLPGEVEPGQIEIVHALPAERREYYIETYTRSAVWSRMAREKWGYLCMCPNCHNSIMREDGTPYNEVHHIGPLFEGGEDHIDNLAVLCAHHHRYAHYARPDDRDRFRELLLNLVSR